MQQHDQLVAGGPGPRPPTVWAAGAQQVGSLLQQEAGESTGALPAAVVGWAQSRRGAQGRARRRRRRLGGRRQRQAAAPRHKCNHFDALPEQRTPSDSTQGDSPCKPAPPKSPLSCSKAESTRACCSTSMVCCTRAHSTHSKRDAAHLLQHGQRVSSLSAVGRRQHNLGAAVRQRLGRLDGILPAAAPTALKDQPSLPRQDAESLARHETNDPADFKPRWGTGRQERRQRPFRWENIRAEEHRVRRRGAPGRHETKGVGASRGVGCGVRAAAPAP